MAHTKGKWSHDGQGTILDEDGFSIANLDQAYHIDNEWGSKGASHWSDEGFCRETDDEVSLANANLISAAPDMLEALELLMQQYESKGQLLGFDVNIAITAINKAKGI